MRFINAVATFIRLNTTYSYNRDVICARVRRTKNNMAARSSNWTKEETEILVDGYVANREVLFGKFSSTITNEEKEKTFCAILES